MLGRSSLTSLPDGTAVFAYSWRTGVFVARAAPGQPFGPGVRVARGTRGWEVGSPSVASSRTGDLLVSWEETPADPLGRCGFECFARVHAVVAPAGGAFGAPALVSPVGNVAWGEVAAIGAGGERRGLRKALRAGRLRVPIVAENRAGRLLYDHAAI